MTMGISKGCLAWAGVVALIGTLQARADTPASASELEEITVTAQKRAESEQTVPLSMTTFSAVALQEKAVVDFFDYGTKVPNLGFAYTGDGMSTARTISIRGVSGDNVTGFYVDETPLPDSLDPRILDIDHIEVLRGPQGTLYGARSMGGTVRVITKTPDFTDSEVTVHAGMSDTARTDQPNYTGDIVANFPLVSDRAALRLSAFMDDEAGYFKRRYCTDPATAGVTCFPQTTGPLTTTVDNVGEVKNYGAAIGLSIKLTDDMMLTPRLLQQKSTYNGFLMSDVLTAPGQIGYPYPAGPYTLPSLVPTNFTQGRFFNIPEGGFDNWQLNSIDFKWNTGVGEFVSSSSYFSRKVIETEDETDFIWTALLPAVAANPAYPNIPGYPPGRISPTTGLPLPIPSAISEEKDYQRFVEEVRFASQLSGPVQFVTGLFYSDLHGAIPFAANYFPALAPGYGAQLTAANTCGIVGLCPNPANPDEIYGSHYKTDVEEPAVYGQVCLRPSVVSVLGGVEGHGGCALEPSKDHRGRVPGGHRDPGAWRAFTSRRSRCDHQGEQHDTEARARLSNHAGRHGLRLRGQGIQAGRSRSFGARSALRQPAASRRDRGRDSRLSIGLPVELRARHEDRVVRESLDGRRGDFLHRLEEHPAEYSSSLRLSVQSQRGRRLQQRRRDRGACAADRSAGAHLGRRQPERENHPARRRTVAAPGGGACIRGPRLDRQYVRDLDRTVVR
jgi:hypothetical protein